MSTDKNTSPGPAITPELDYRTPRAVIQRLVDVFGFDVGLVVEGPDGEVAHAELWWRDAAIFIGHREDQGDERGGSALCLAVDDEDEVDRIYERAQASRAPVAFELADTAFGSHQFAVLDAEGNSWTVGTYRPRRE